ncbi:hypothetical protein H4R19_006724, partial [Coemansia spiralis]
QRRSDGAPGYSFTGPALSRLVGAEDEDTAFSNRMLTSRASIASTVVAGSSPMTPPDILDIETMASDTDTDTEDAPTLPPPPPPLLSASLNTLHIPRAPFTAPTLGVLVQQLPALSRLSVSLRTDAALFGASDSSPVPSKKQWAHASLRWIGLSADEGVLADPRWLAVWLRARFPGLLECSTNHARSHWRTVAELSAAAPEIRFTRLGLQRPSI